MNLKLSLKVAVSLLFSCTHSTNPFAMEQMEDKKPLLIFHAAYEAPNAKVGGLGAVVTDLLEKQNTFFVGYRKAITPYVLTPFYQFLKESVKDEVTFFCEFQHDTFDYTGTTKVYKHSTLNQFLLEPDPKMAECMKIVKTEKDIYETTQAYCRLVYWNSAVAKFTYLYEENAKTVDILHVHGWHSGLAVPLLSKIYNPDRRNCGFREIKTVATTHMHSSEQGIENSIIYEHIGMPKLGISKEINIARIMNLECNITSTVSHGVADEMLSSKTGYGLDHIFQSKKRMNSFVPITNGIDHKNYDPTQNNILAQFTVHKNHHDLAQKKNEVKNILYKHKIIGDGNRSLMIFVGRYGSEKGVSLLPTIANEWIELGGQVVIMGAFTEDNTAKETIETMKRDNKSPYLKIYTDYQQNQNTKLSDDVAVKKGNLLRFASDWTAVPSFVEACGLVPMEALSFGSAVFTSWAQGLKDVCKPLDVSDFHTKLKIDRNQFNSIAYCYSPDSEEFTLNDIRKNLKKAYDIQHKSSKNWEQYQMRWCKEAKQFDWSSQKGPLQQYYDMYQHTIKNL